METKELKIQAPEGYEIDRESSTLECIKFKPIKEGITYNAICKKLDFNYYINGDGKVCNLSGYPYNRDDKNIAYNKKQLKRVLALNQLLNIAEYYNTNTAEFNTRYRICYDSINYYYKVAPYASYNFTYSLEALFNDEEDAQAVIDNPNFREILDTIYKD